eukprot:1161798-Pelagomonas_calceolata.AAC.14
MVAASSKASDQQRRDSGRQASTSGMGTAGFVPARSFQVNEASCIADAVNWILCTTQLSNSTCVYRIPSLKITCAHESQL